jgi:hypothetical protein
MLAKVQFFIYIYRLQETNKMRIGSIESISAEDKTELENILKNLDLVGSIGAAIKTHRAEAKRLERKIESIESRGTYAPEGQLFAVTSRGNHFEVAPYHRAFDGYDDSGWEGDRAVKYEKLDFSMDFKDKWVFVAKKIETGLPHTPNSSAVYAYSVDGNLRCRISDNDFEVNAFNADEELSHVINDTLLEKMAAADIDSVPF